MEHERREAHAAIGGSSLLTIFAVLCLTVFAVLTLATASAGVRLSDSTAAAVEAYYAADCAAEEILARLRAGECPEGVTEKNGIFYYCCPISDTQTLMVEAAVKAEEYQILRWQAVPSAQWEAEEQLRVWDGT